jgi:CBS domain-containing protein
MTPDPPSPTPLGETPVADVMHPGIVSCQRDSTAIEIARLMSAAAVHSVAVLSPSPEQLHDPLIWGIVTDLNLLAALAEDTTTATAESLATEQVIRIRSTDTVNDAASAMVRYNAHHLVVIDPETNAPIGILSTVDIGSALARRG